MAYYFDIYTYYDIASVDYSDAVAVQFEYDAQKRIKKRVGGVIAIASNPLYSHRFTDYIYRDLVYNDNTISMVSYTTPSYPEYQDNEDIIILDTQNRMIQKTTYDEFKFPQRDTITYTYVGNKLANYVKTSYDLDRRRIEESTLFYSYENLDSIVTVFSNKFDNSNVKITKKETEIFSNYDNSFNPFKALGIFNESFTRSLSENNYTNYSKWSNTYVYPDPESQEGYYLPRDDNNFTIRNWTFSYDNNGDWIYDDF